MYAPRHLKFFLGFSSPEIDRCVFIWSPKPASGVCPDDIPLDLLTGSSLIVTRRASCLTQGQLPCSVCLPRAESAGVTKAACIFTWLWRFKLQSSGSRRSALTTEGVSSTPGGHLKVGTDRRQDRWMTCVLCKYFGALL